MGPATHTAPTRPLPGTQRDSTIASLVPALLESPSSPLALPAALGHCEQWRVQAVGVIADVTVVTQQQARGVRGLAAHLAHNALHAAPALQEHHLGNLREKTEGHPTGWAWRVGLWLEGFGATA